MAKMLAEPLRMALGTMAEILLAGPPLQNICREAAPGRNAIRKTQLPGAPGRIADAAGGKERKQMSACRCG